jgi:molybdopterin-guanine dinucleotide biosynthesis protein A
MGSDKALLPFREGTLLEHMARIVRQAAGNVTVVGPASRYGHLGLRIVEDRMPGCGPLAGIHAALLDSPAEWTLIVACDLPNLRADLLSWILDHTVDCDADVLWTTLDGERPEPLCGAYRRTAAAVVAQALDSGNLKITKAFAPLRRQMLRVSDALQLANVNTPEQWREVPARGDR